MHDIALIVMGSQWYRWESLPCTQTHTHTLPHPPASTHKDPASLSIGTSPLSRAWLVCRIQGSSNRILSSVVALLFKVSSSSWPLYSRWTQTFLGYAHFAQQQSVYICVYVCACACACLCVVKCMYVTSSVGWWWLKSALWGPRLQYFKHLQIFDCD